MTNDLPDERAASVIDPRPRQLLERYAALVGGMLLDLGDGLTQLEVPAGERQYWQNAATKLIAMNPDALDGHPEAELLGIGSPTFEQLLSAVRARGFLDVRGMIPPATSDITDAGAFPLPLDGASAGQAENEIRLIPVGRLLARVSIKAGPRLEERLVESPLVDLTTGVRIPSIASVLPGPESVATPPPGSIITVRRAPTELLPLLFTELEQELAGDIARIEVEARSGLRGELDRLERYYETMLEEVEPGEDGEETKAAKRAIRSERDRRKGEETERFQLKVALHPLQLTEWLLPTQQASWPLTGPKGISAQFNATRPLSGDTTWRYACVTCGAIPTAIRVCASGHASCPSCSERCGVCATTTCKSHGLSTCAVEGHAVCREHARSCASCGTAHCTTHATYCPIGDHEVCPACARLCARCEAKLCRMHATATDSSAPLGSRWLCEACTVYCEGGTDEPVGRDEVAKCASCDHHVCRTHQARCVVDSAVHCSKHLRRSDQSGRLSCQTHRATCAEEPTAVLVSDEVFKCAACGRSACGVHSGTCDADGAHYCLSHLSPLADRPGARGCPDHRTTCHVDGVTFSTTGTEPCPVCGRPSCQSHQGKCLNCSRRVCVRDLSGGTCSTCSRLEAIGDPTDEMIHGILAANGGAMPRVSTWRWSRDVTGTVVEADLGWTRRLVFTLNAGDPRPRTVTRHSILGARRVR